MKGNTKKILRDLSEFISTSFSSLIFYSYEVSVLVHMIMESHP